MRRVIQIFRKELKDTLRDRRTIMTMLVVPLMIYPILMIVFARITESQANKAMEEVPTVAVINESAADLIGYLAQNADLDLEHPSGDMLPSLKAAVASGEDSLIRMFLREQEFDLLIYIPPGFTEAVEGGVAGKVMLYHSSAKENNIALNQVEMLTEQYRQQILNERFEQRNLPREFAEAITVEKIDVATQKEVLGKFLGGILPYFFIIFLFMGSMYPAIDLVAGEKERGTIETILSTPASNLELLLGKMGVIILTGITSAVVSLAGILVSIKTVDFIPPEILDTFLGLVEPKAIILILMLLLPLSILFASVLICISIYARTFKEAQSIITPMMILIILPAIVGMIPGMELTPVTALVPILNVSMATKMILSGSLNPWLYFEAVAALLVYAGIALIFSIKWFGKESNILR